MLMPEAAMDENNEVRPWEYQVRLPRKLRVATSEAVAEAVKI